VGQGRGELGGSLGGAWGELGGSLGGAWGELGGSSIDLNNIILLIYNINTNINNIN